MISQIRSEAWRGSKGRGGQWTYQNGHKFILHFSPSVVDRVNLVDFLIAHKHAYDEFCNMHTHSTPDSFGSMLMSIYVFNYKIS